MKKFNNIGDIKFQIEIIPFVPILDNAECNKVIRSSAMAASFVVSLEQTVTNV